MELVLKLSKGKPPFIGVLFNFENQAASMNKEWAENYGSFVFELILQPSQKLYIKLLNGNLFSERYEVNYDPVELIKFLYVTKDCTQFNFGHLQLKDGKYKVPKTRGHASKLLFKIKSVKVQVLTLEV